LAGILAFPRADFGQSIELLDRGLALSRQHQDTPGIALALGGLGRVAQYQGRWEDAERFHAESLPLFEQTGDRWGVGWSLEMSGRLALSNGDYDLATRLCEESLRIGQTMGDRRNVALALRDLARAAYARRDYARTEALSQQGLEQAQSLGFRRSIAWALHMLGLAAHQRRDPARALDLLCESLDLRELLDDQEGVAECLEAIAAAWLGRHALTAEGTDRDAARRAPGGRRSLDRQSALHAARLLAAAERLRETIGTPLSPAERLVWLPNRDRIRTTLSEQELLDAHVAGAQLSSEQAVEEALTVRPQAEQARTSGPLSRREEEVAILVARGLTNRKIAERLVIGERTVATHIEHILNKLGFRSRAQVAAWATDARSSDAE
jgi:non-specific serine/threonine protein kinase